MKFLLFLVFAFFGHSVYADSHGDKIFKIICGSSSAGVSPSSEFFTLGNNSDTVPGKDGKAHTTDLFDQKIWQEKCKKFAKKSNKGIGELQELIKDTEKKCNDGCYSTIDRPVKYRGAKVSDPVDRCLLVCHNNNKMRRAIIEGYSRGYDSCKESSKQKATQSTTVE